MATETLGNEDEIETPSQGVPTNQSIYSNQRPVEIKREPDTVR